MKLRYSLLILASLQLFVSCQEVITVDLPDLTPKLIVDALIRIDTTQSFTLAEIKLTETIRTKS
jgi:hypothetical protein